MGVFEANLVRIGDSDVKIKGEVEERAHGEEVK